jgi:hypothetical protein
MSILDGGRVTVRKARRHHASARPSSWARAPARTAAWCWTAASGASATPALGARLDTTGNLSIGRLGTGSVGPGPQRRRPANLVVMSTVRRVGQFVLAVGVNSTVTAAGHLAGIGLSPNAPGYDPNSPNHGTALISVRDTGFINAPSCWAPAAP